MEDTLTSRQALQNLLLIFADFFTFPSKEFHELVITGSLDQQVQKLSQSIGYPLSPNFQEEAWSYDQWVKAYNRCFIGTHHPFAPPVESVYKQWTTDESFQVPFKNKKGHLMGDSAQHIQHIIKAFGLEIPPEYSLTPDHLTIILELLAFLVVNGFNEEAKQFCQDHLDWLPDLQKALEKLPSTESHYYIYILKELQGIVRSFDELINNISGIKATYIRE